ncbi:MAG: hypothetical protein PUG98_10620 [Clostridium sp.]|nr:hypothetical protein [Clostridium sp.]
MGNRYKRMVTLGMVSFTAILAWVYCALAYRTETVYIAIISLVLIASIYAFLLSLVDIRIEKEQQMQEYIAKTLQESLKQDNSDVVDCLNDMERLAKASYVQQRKMATYLSSQEEQLDAAVKKTAKLLIGYDRKKEEEAAQKAEQKEKEEKMQAALEEQKKPDHTAMILDAFEKLTGDVQAVVAQLAEVTAQITALRDSVDAIEIPKVVETVAPVASVAEAPAQVAETAVADALPQPADIVQDVEPEAADIMQTVEPEVSDIAQTVEPEVAEPDHVQDMEPEATEIAQTVEPEAADVRTELEHVQDMEPEAPHTEQEESATFDTEDFFSQFGGSEDQALKEEAQFKEDTTNAGMMDQSMIDALLGNLASGNKSADNTKPADVIPFPQQEQMDVSKEEAHTEEIAEAANEMEHEIEAAVAATEEEENHTDTASVTQAPVDDNPNRTLSPEEIAALFASMQ